FSARKLPTTYRRRSSSRPHLRKSRSSSSSSSHSCSSDSSSLSSSNSTNSLSSSVSSDFDEEESKKMRNANCSTRRHHCSGSTSNDTNYRINYHIAVQNSDNDANNNYCQAATTTMANQLHYSAKRQQDVVDVTTNLHLPDESSEHQSRAKRQ